jgi:hypothetical protein
VLGRLRIDEPPVTPRAVMEGLKLGLDTLPSFDLERLDPEQLTLFGSVKGLFSPSENKVYLSEDLARRQEQWVIYHEGAHAEIAWHRDLLYLDNEYTLGFAVREQMEREANAFAGHLQFLGPRFAADSRELPFGIPSVRLLADRYDASVESSLRRYVETSGEDCVCGVFRIGRHADGRHETLTFRYFVKPAAKRTYWPFPWRLGQTLPEDDPLVALLNEGRLAWGAVHQDTYYEPGSKTARHREVFCNGHRVFVLMRKV